MNRFLKFVGIAAVVCAVLVVSGIILAYSGFYNVAATTAHNMPVEQMLRITLMRSVTAHARDVHAPADFHPQDPALVAKGAGHYEAMCRTCHGAPGRKPNLKGLYPAAPDLADALRVTRWSDAEVYWIIKNGIKDTGMAAFGSSADDDELWALTAFVRQLPIVSRDQYQTMTEHAPMHAEAAHETESHVAGPAQPHHH